MKKVIPSLRTEKLRILVDSSSVTNALVRGNQGAVKFLSYAKCDLFQLLRTPSLLDPILAWIPEVHVTNNAIGFPTSLHVALNGGWSRTLFPYDSVTITRQAESIFNKALPNHQDIQRIILCLILQVLAESGYVDFMVTDDNSILSNRTWFESSNNVAIVTLSEALEIIDVFSKRKGVYFLSNDYDVGSSWYW